MLILNYKSKYRRHYTKTSLFLQRGFISLYSIIFYYSDHILNIRCFVLVHHAFDVTAMKSNSFKVSKCSGMLTNELQQEVCCNLFRHIRTELPRSWRGCFCHTLSSCSALKTHGWVEVSFDREQLHTDRAFLWALKTFWMMLNSRPSRELCQSDKTSSAPGGGAGRCYFWDDHIEGRSKKLHVHYQVIEFMVHSLLKCQNKGFMAFY